MSFESIPDFVLFEIMKFIPDNKSSINFLKTCKYLKTLFYEHGYLKSLSYQPLLQNNMYRILTYSIKHKRTLNSISVAHFQNPQHWIFVWPKVMVFNCCTINEPIDPPSEVHTEVLYVLNDRSNTVNINWYKFPNLKRLEFTDWNINFNNIKYCKNLTSTRVGSKRKILNLRDEDDSKVLHTSLKN